MSQEIEIRPVLGKSELKAFVELPWRIYADDPYWVPPLKVEVYSLLTPGKNPFFEHARVHPMLAWRGGEVVGRISAHIDTLALEQPVERGMGPGTGNWGMLEAFEEPVAAALIAAAEQWLREQGMHRALGPLSLSIWDEPGQLVSGHEQAPTVMMGHQRAAYAGWIEDAGYTPIKRIMTWELPIDVDFPRLAKRIIQSGEKNPRIHIRRVDKSHFAQEAALIMGLLNDAWSKNWGFVPLTDSEIDYVGKKLKPIVYEDLIRIAEYDGKPVAFMITLPDLNEKLKGYDGALFPFNWARLLWWLRKPQVRTMRVPLMGVARDIQGSRLASQLAFMMIEYIRRDAVAKFGATRGEIGWILEDNQGMNSIGEILGGTVNKVYQLYDKNL